MRSCVHFCMVFLEFFKITLLFFHFYKFVVISKIDEVFRFFFEFFVYSQCIVYFFFIARSDITQFVLDN